MDALPFDVLLLIVSYVLRKESPWWGLRKVCRRWLRAVWVSFHHRAGSLRLRWPRNICGRAPVGPISNTEKNQISLCRFLEQASKYLDRFGLSAVVRRVSFVDSRSTDNAGAINYRFADAVDAQDFPSASVVAVAKQLLHQLPSLTAVDCTVPFLAALGGDAATRLRSLAVGSVVVRGVTESKPVLQQELPDIAYCSLLTSLRELRVGLEPLSAVKFLSSMPALSMLELLQLEVDSRVDNFEMTALFSRCGSLTTLRLVGAWNDPLPQSCWPHLLELDVAGAWRFDDRDITATPSLLGVIDGSQWRRLERLICQPGEVTDGFVCCRR